MRRQSRPLLLRASGPPALSAWEATVLLMQGGTAVDQSRYGRAITLAGGASANSALWQVGGANTIRVNGSQGTWITWARSVELELVSKDWTYEGWWRVTGSAGAHHYYVDGTGGTVSQFGFDQQFTSLTSGLLRTNVNNQGWVAHGGTAHDATAGVFLCVERFKDDLYLSIGGGTPIKVALAAGFTFNAPTLTDTRIGVPTSIGGTVDAHTGPLRWTVGVSRYKGQAIGTPPTSFPIGA